MKVLDGYWVKPFGTGMSCIDTVDAECPRGLSLEECMKRCEDSPYCNAGYHVSFDDLPLQSYCVPLNTIFYQNSNFLDNVIAPHNSTRLSADNGIHLRVFYNPERFPPDTNLLDTPYLFFSNTCFLVQDRGSLGRFYLHSDFTFYPFRETAMTVVLGQEGTLFFDFDQRITSRSSVYFIKNNEYSVLYYDRDTGVFSWRPYSASAYTYAFRDHPDGFVNEQEPFQLFNTRHDQFLSVDLTTNKLQWSDHKARYPLSFELDPTSVVNQFSRSNWKEMPRLFPQFWESLNEKQIPQFLCENFKNCLDRTAPPLPLPRAVWIVVLILGILTILVWLLIIVLVFTTQKGQGKQLPTTTAKQTAPR